MSRNEMNTLKFVIVPVYSMLLILSNGATAAWNNPYSSSGSMENTYYGSFSENPHHLDPALSYSSSELVFIGQIYEPLLQYHYLKRPHTLIPLTATALPQPKYYDAENHLLPEDTDLRRVVRTTYRVSIKPGIYYQPHPAFARNGEGGYLYHHLSPEELKKKRRFKDFTEVGSRELTAEDYVYQVMRLVHPATQSPVSSFMSQYIVGLKELGMRLQQHPKQDLRQFYFPGARALDRYTLEFTINGYYPQFLYWLSMAFFSPVPWEADAFYHQPGMREHNLTLDSYPIGTGPFMIGENRPNFRIVLIKNPNFRDEFYPDNGEESDRKNGFLSDEGKKLPLLDKAIYQIEKESIPTWNKFLQGYYDLSGINSDNFDQVIQFNQNNPGLTEEIQNRGIRLQTAVATSVLYVGFNMLDDIVGGYEDRARALRQAISIALDYEEYISIFANGRGQAAHGPIPPGIFGYRNDDFNPYVYNQTENGMQRKSVARARTLLADAGYTNGIDPKTGEPLVLYLDTVSQGPGAKALLDWYRKQFKKIGIALIPRVTDYNRFQDKMRTGKAQLFTWGWNADYPDPENFLFLLYGANSKVHHGGENTANYQNPHFDMLYKQMQLMKNGSEKQHLIDEMLSVLRHDAPWIWGFYPVSYILHHAWYHNDKPNLVANNTLKYKRVDNALRMEKQDHWNHPYIFPLGLVAILIIIMCYVMLRLYQRREAEHP